MSKRWIELPLSLSKDGLGFGYGLLNPYGPELIVRGPDPQVLIRLTRAEARRLAREMLSITEKPRP